MFSLRHGNRKLKFGGLALALLAGVAAVASAAEVEVTATVDRNQVAVGDVVQLTISVSAKDSVNVEEPRLGNLPGFELINTSSGYETKSSFVNGRFITEQARTFTFMLAATRKGSLTIPDLPISVDGRTVRTKPIQVAVSEERKGGPVARHRGQPDPFEQMDDMEELFNQMLQRRFGPGRPGIPPGEPVNPNDAFFILAETDKTKAFVGEQVTANFYLVTRGQIRDIDTLKYPDLKGFWKEDLEMATRLNFEPVVINGIPHQRALLVSYALFPIKPGTATVDTYKAKCTVLTPSTFGFGRPLQLTKSSSPVNISVVQVPTGAPPNFTGAVGDFKLSARFEPPTGSVNQPVTLRVRVEGQGNAKLIELPKLDLPPSLEVYDQKSQSKFLKDGSSFKEFEVLVIPRQPGVFKIPPVKMATFDPKTRKFAELATVDLDLTVTGTGTATPGVAAPAPAAPSGGPGTAAGGGAPAESELPPLATEWDGGGGTRGLWIALTAALYALCVAFLLMAGWRQLRSGPRKASLKAVLKARLAKAAVRTRQGQARELGVELANLIYYILGHLSDLGGASREIGALLEQTPPSLRNEVGNEIRSVLAQCEALSFAPEGLVGALSGRPALEKLMAKVENVLSRAIELSEV